MLLSHQSILACINDGVIKGGKAGSVGPVSYDLTTQNFFADKTSYNQKLASYTLNPGDSVLSPLSRLSTFPAILPAA